MFKNGTTIPNKSYIIIIRGFRGIAEGKGNMEELKKCPFCGENKAKLVYMNEETQEAICVDTEEELNDSNIYAYVHCYGCDIDFCADTMKKPKDVINAWNNRV